MKKLLALLLTLCLVIGMVPLAASAAGEEGNEDTQKSAAQTLAEALGTGNATVEGNTVTLTENVSLKKGITVEGTVILDLAGKTISASENWSSESGNDFLVAVKRGGNLTINDSSDGKTGAISSGSVESAMCAVKMTIKDENAGGDKAVLTVNGGTLTGFFYGIAGNGTRHGTEITINEGKVTGEKGTGIYHPQEGTLTINEGEISGLTGVELRSGTMVMNGGTIKSTAEQYNEVANDGGTTVTGAALAISQHTTKKGISVTISGGTLEGPNAFSQTKVQDESATPENITLKIESGDFKGDVKSDNVNNFISGGTFDEPVKAHYCEDGKAPLVTEGGCTIANKADLTDMPKDENGVYYDTDAAEEKFEATVTTAEGTKGYDTLEKALEAAQNNDTITLLKDVTISGGAGDTQGILTIERDIIIDGQNHSITAEDTVTQYSSMINIQNGAKVTIKNVTIDSNKKAKHGLNTYTAPDATEKTTVTLENVEIKNGTGYGIVANNTVVNATNLTTSGNGWGGVNVDKGAQVTIGGTTNLGEESSIVYENAKTDTNGDKGSLTVNGGTYKNIVVQAEGEEDEIVGTVSLTGGTFNGVLSKGKGDTNAADVVNVTGGKFAQTSAGDVPSDGNYVAIKDLIPEDYEISSDGTVKEEEPYVPPVIPTYKTTVEECEGGSVVASPSSAREGQKVTLTVKPQAGQELKSLKVTDKDGDAVTLTKVEGGYTFNMPKGSVKVTAVFGCDGTGDAYEETILGAIYGNKEGGSRQHCREPPSLLVIEFLEVVKPRWNG